MRTVIAASLLVGFIIKSGIGGPNKVLVRGNVQGSIRGNAVTFRSSGRVEADVFHKTLSIEQGAFFEGKSRRSEDPTAGVARPEIPDLSARMGDSSSSNS